MEARELFEGEGYEWGNGRLVLADDGRSLRFEGVDQEGYRIAVDIRADTEPEPEERFSPVGVLRFEYDEPPGAGNDPYGRPDPKTHPEAWTE